MRQGLVSLFAFVTLTGSAAAHAGLLVEPYLGYSVGRAHPDHKGARQQNLVTFGGRLGYSMLGFMAGVDYLTGRGEATGNPRLKLTPSQLGLFAGFNFPILLRGYVVYIPINRLTTDHDHVTHTYDGGDAVKFGVGWTGLPFVSVNFEYTKASYRGLDSDTYAITASLPFDL